MTATVPFYAAQSVVSHSLSSLQAAGGSSALPAAVMTLAIVVGLLFVLHWVTQMVSALVANSAQVGPVVILVFTFVGLLAAAFLINPPG